MTPEEKKKRANSARLEQLKTTNCHDQKPYVFISYKSDDWKEVLENIAFRMQKEYGLRVYYDRDFERSNKKWFINMQQNIRNPYCLCLLAFFSESYVASYATLMELLTSQSSSAANVSEDENVKSIIPIFLGENGSFKKYTGAVFKTMQYKNTGIESNERKVLKEIAADCLLEDGTTPPGIVAACKKISLLNDKDELQHGTVAECFKLAKEDLVGQYKAADGSKFFYSDLRDTIEEIQNEVFDDESSVFDSALVCLEDLNIPMTDQEKTDNGAKKEPEPKPETVSITVISPESAPEPEPSPMPKAEKQTGGSETPTYSTCSSLEKQVTIGDVRARFAKAEQVAQFREVRESMPRGGKGAMDYAMAAILGGCNQITVKSPAYQIYYYTQAVADPDASKDGKGLGATWTWSSSCRRILNLKGSGIIPDEVNEYFKSLPENTTLGQLEQDFFAAESICFQTKKNDLVIVALHRIMEYMAS